MYKFDNEENFSFTNINLEFKIKIYCNCWTKWLWKVYTFRYLNGFNNSYFEDKLLIDGKFNRFDLNAYKAQIGFVPQEDIFFDGTHKR